MFDVIIFDYLTNFLIQYINHLILCNLYSFYLIVLIIVE
jgi:hypothetical protein